MSTASALLTQSQLLATILSLVIGISIAASALTTLYTWRAVSQLVGAWTFWYALPFLTGIIWSLFLAGSTPIAWEVWIAFGLSAGCVLLVPSYLLSLATRLDLRFVAYRIVGTGATYDATRAYRDPELTTTEALARSALDKHDLVTVQLVADALTESFQVSLGERDSLAARIALRSLGKILAASCDRATPATPSVILTIVGAFESAVSSKRWDVVKTAIEVVRSIAAASIANPDTYNIEASALLVLQTAELVGRASRANRIGSEANEVFGLEIAYVRVINDLGEGMYALLPKYRRLGLGDNFLKLMFTALDRLTSVAQINTLLERVMERGPFVDAYMKWAKEAGAERQFQLLFPGVPDDQADASGDVEP